MSDKQIVTIAGGGSGYTPGIVLTILNHKEFEVKEIRLYDDDPIKNEKMEIIISYILEKGNYNITFKRTEDPKEAFINTDFIFSQIRVGKIEMREKDEKIPLKHGIVGQETCGLGGFSYGIRSMKGFLKLVEDIQTYAPDAWILNYTNPETIVAEAIRREYPNIKIINACDMTIGIEEIISKSFGLDRSNWIPIYYGLNHFGWYDSIYDVSLGRDIMPEILEKIKKEGIDVSGEEPSWAQTYENMKVIVENFPTHIPNNYLEYYLYPNLTIKQTDPTYTRANQIMEGRLQQIDDTVERIKDGKATDLDYESSGHGQYIVDIAASILHNKNDRFMLIVPNKGAIPNLREDAVVEVPSYVNAKGVEPISLRFNIPDFHKGLMEAQVASEKLLVDAFFENSYQKALEAFTLNQTVPNASVAKAVLDELIEANGNYWPELK
ncbi:MAG TPA: 6-phospho-alpha-glucosidase [Candidatus Atopostipes pullistercoris]|uniref:6-phospho-alpha-glucosidase n=1 Tax=Candidatus Atopostipes pullistercoris TaxID=2838467 RepID=A0A9D2G3J0_9LACT|nr:6-phospho-alpha-glucosidase [Candidatus Atopostipes pullistercoris]